MTDQVRVKSMSVFDGSAEGRLIEVGDEFDVSFARAAELEANGLVVKLDEMLAGASQPEVEVPVAEEASEFAVAAPAAETAAGRGKRKG